MTNGKIVCRIGSPASFPPPQPKTEDLDWLAFVLFVFTVVLRYYVTFWNRPVHAGHRNYEEAQAALKRWCPERSITPSRSTTAPIAVLFALIGSSDATMARRAIQFAADSEYGYASPYVIERLQSQDPALRQAAHAFLIGIAGKDYGGSADAWRAWWRDPPREAFGMQVGQHTLESAMPVLVLLLSFLFCGVRLLRPRAAPAWTFVGAGLVLAWFPTVGVVSMRFQGSWETCVFGSDTIFYQTSKGIVLGLGRSGLGSGSLTFFLSAAAFFVGFGGIVCAGRLFDRLLRRRGKPQRRRLS